MSTIKNTGSILLFCFIANFAFAQAEMKPYIQTDGGSVIEYDEVDATFFGNYRATNGETKTKYSRKELKSVLVGKKGAYKTSKYAQLVFTKIKISGGLFKVSVEDGDRPFEVIVSNGTDMILSAWKGSITSPGNLVSNTQYGYDAIYYVKGSSGIVIMFADLFKAEFLDELIASFGSCEAVKTILVGYKESSVKPISAFEIIYKIKDAYYTSCYLK